MTSSSATERTAMLTWMSTTIGSNVRPSTRQFRTKHSCQQHMDALDHWAPVFKCETCIRTFSSQDAANQHMNAKNHRQPTVPCETCSQMFYTEETADQHMEAEGHYANYCAECDRSFANENWLRQVREPSQFWRDSKPLN
ncbi:unnamed protein product [Penicillium egyptiacum]|uniref:C2H2-type domain-containing protein n=1 Tax=Penicillium egyptiacum TaxID=1303716 RepID=A0A9W4KB81_9EURO|nr:unnamed protein product [Penicillium egyptiacum]